MGPNAIQPPYVLVVDDDADIREMLSILLRKNGFKTLTAVDREEALEVMADNHVKTVLLDYMMPGPSATKFLDILGWNYPKAQVILMTAGDRVNAVADTLGIEKYIGKPFDERTLLCLLNACDKPPVQFEI